MNEDTCVSGAAPEPPAPGRDAAIDEDIRAMTSDGEDLTTSDLRDFAHRMFALAGTPQDIITALDTCISLGHLTAQGGVILRAALANEKRKDQR